MLFNCDSFLSLRDEFSEFYAVVLFRLKFLKEPFLSLVLEWLDFMLLLLLIGMFIESSFEFAANSGT